MGKSRGVGGQSQFGIGCWIAQIDMDTVPVHAQSAHHLGIHCPVVALVANTEVRIGRNGSILCEQTMGSNAEKSDQNSFNHSVCIVFQ